MKEPKLAGFGAEMSLSKEHHPYQMVFRRLD